jgi:hypothetical protein
VVDVFFLLTSRRFRLSCLVHVVQSLLLLACKRLVR